MGIEATNAYLPLMEAASGITGRRGISLPFTDGCEPLCENEQSFRELWAHAMSLGIERRWKSIELRGGRKWMSEAPASLSFYGHTINLAGGETAIFEQMAGAARQGVRRAEMAGVKVEISQSLTAVHDFYRLLCLTRQRHGLPPQPLKFFLNIHRHILSQNQGFIAVANHSGNKFAASVFFFLGSRAIYKYGASDYAQQHLRGNNLVMWTAMQWLARQKVTHLHLGKTAPANGGLRRFKLNLGAKEETIEYMKFDLRLGRFIVDHDDTAGWHNRVFSAKPMWASQLAGRLLYKHWALFILHNVV